MVKAEEGDEDEEEEMWGKWKPVPMEVQNDVAKEEEEVWDTWEWKWNEEDEVKDENEWEEEACDEEEEEWEVEDAEEEWKSAKEDTKQETDWPAHLPRPPPPPPPAPPQNPSLDIVQVYSERFSPPYVMNVFDF